MKKNQKKKIKKKKVPNKRGRFPPSPRVISQVMPMIKTYLLMPFREIIT
jgi:hypothetical protein